MTAHPRESGPAEGRYLLCSRKDGIGARLVNLLWTWRLARTAGLKTLCFWPPLDPYYGDSTGAADLLDLFTVATSELQDELKIVDARPIDCLHVRTETIDPEGQHDPLAYAVAPRPGRGSKSAPVPLIDTGMGPLLAPGESPHEATREARELFARLPLALRIRQSLKGVEKTHNFERMVAVHVRRGDIVEVLRGACRSFTPEALEPGSVLDRYTEHFFRGCAPAPNYIRLVRPYLKQGFGILFFSDTPGEEHPFQKRFPYKLTLAADLAPKALTPIQRALFEMLMMSRCHAIIASKSTFSSLASLIGGAPWLDVRKQTTPEEFLRAYKRAIGFDRLAPEARAGVTEVLVRKLGQNRLLERWEADGEEILRILKAA
jgi:hypothetical protein